jgi:hypothetical protein
LIKSEICPCFFYGSNMCCDSYKIYEIFSHQKNIWNININYY